MAVCIPEIAGHDAEGELFVIIFVRKAALFLGIGEKSALYDDRRTAQHAHEIDRAFGLLRGAAVFRVAALDERTLHRLGERLTGGAVRGVKDLCAVVLRVGEFVEVDADKTGEAKLFTIFSRARMSATLFSRTERAAS